MQQEVLIVKRRVGIPNSEDISVYMEHDGYRALRKALTELTPDEVIEIVKASGLRRCRFPDRCQVGFCAQKHLPKVCLRQLR